MTKSPTKPPRANPTGKSTPQRTTRRAPGSGKAQALPDDPVHSSITGKSSKLDLMTVLLRRPEGASLAELAEVTGWQLHSVRGAMSGALKRKGRTVTSEVTDGVRRYRTGSPE